MTTSIKCKICGYVAEDGNLVPHVQSEHPELSLREYMEVYGGETSLMHPTVLKAAKAAKDGKKRAKSKGDKVELFGIEFEKRKDLTEELKLLIPKKNEHYEYQSFAEDVVYDISQDSNIALTGHCGTGKTSLITQLASELGQPVVRVNTNQQTTYSDFVGCYTVKGSEMEWIDGSLPYAMKNGCWLIIDEIDYAEPGILSALNAVLERNTEGRKLMLMSKGNEIVTAHPNFRIFATGNTLGQMSEYRSLYQGTAIMNEAFNDRWPRLYLVDYMPEDQEAKLLTKIYEKMPLVLAKKLVQVASAVRKSFVEESMQCTLSTRRLIDWAEMVGRKSKHGPDAIQLAAESTILSKISREDATAFKGFLQRVFFKRS